ncbi:amino acid ABC transporter substrate-binding protein, partial [Gardnerella vaginalis]
MKNKKMMAIAALALAGMLTLTGCGANGNAAKSAAKPQASEQKADDKGGDKGFEEVPVGPNQDQNIG